MVRSSKTTNLVGTLVSIVIPTYNRGNILPVAIDSVLKQTHSNWELILIDDGSTDNSREVVEPYLTDERITYYFKDNSGVSAARNKGIDLANGQYIIFLDSDDYFDKELLENVNQELTNQPDLVCWEVIKIIDSKTKYWKARELGGMYRNIRATFLAGSVCYKKDTLINHGGFDPKISFGENYELGQRISRKECLKIQLINKPLLYNIVKTEDRQSNSIKNRLISYIYIYKKHREKYDQNPKASAEMNYLLGFVLEKANRKNAAFGRYKKSWFANPWNLKPLLKILYLKFVS
ncbi:glycosyltransferase family 2 protein [Salinimicrobium sp. CDJ15-81-2]|nr:glycosyltransferase family 2 protein [Salinimicrobium nanhaiense]